METGQRVAESSACYLIADILSDNSARALTFGAESSLRFDFPVACKTGTSSDFRDNWAFGYTPEFTVGVWVGNFNGAPMRRVSGVTGAAPLMHELVEHLHQRFGTSWYDVPTNVVESWVHRITGKRLLAGTGSASDPDAVKEQFLATHLPDFESTADNEAATPTARRLVRLGGYAEWFASSDNWLHERAVVAPTRAQPRILFPPPGTVVYLDPDLPQQGRRVVLRADGPANLRWQSDSLPLIQEGEKHIVLLAQGRHRLSLSDPDTGARAETWLEVVER